ncbi:hypothetical protein [Marinilactibacillus kalidii]|uniref:hypothetical protein n=1 Tax=Marinilactibacillus kalidii TaxID=2820274 RepID=UPI001ABEE300|nr:hypothetical protein [Marinilactibacillus kalidii]
MNTEETFPIIKKTISASLMDNLNYYTKAQLVEVAKQLKVETKKSWKKSQLVTVLTASIPKQFDQFYKPVVEDILNQFGEQVEQALGFQQIQQIEVLAPLIKKGFFYVYQQENLLVLVIPDEIWMTLWKNDEVEEITFEIDSKKLNNFAVNESDARYKLLQKWKDNAIQIYGHASAVYFSTIWNKYYDEQLTAEQVEDIINR